MDLIYRWFQSNLDIVFFIYGLAFVIMGISVLVQPRQEIEFKFKNILWLFVAYALLHAPSDFLDMWGVIKGRSEAIYIIGQILTYTSYLFLFEFGRRLIGVTKKVLNWWVLPITVAGIAIISVLSGAFWATANILIVYLVRFPAGIMAGLGFIWYYNLEKKTLEPWRLKRYFYMAGASLLAWSFFCGIVRAKGTFFPANWLNTDSFYLTVKIPVYLFRTVCAIILAASFFGMLGFIRYRKETFWFLIIVALSSFLIELTIMVALHFLFRPLSVVPEAFLDSLLLLIMILPLLYRFAFSPLMLEIIQRKRAEEELKDALDELRAAQIQLVQSAKMNSVGRLAAGVAHEINNPIFVISGEAELLLKNANKDSQTKDASKVILEQCGRIKGIIDRLLEFSRPGREFKREPLDVNKVIEESISLLGYQAKMDRISLVRELAVGLPKILGDENQLQEVFLSIMLNAVEAMEKGGELTVKTYSEKIAENAWN